MKYLKNFTEGKNYMDESFEVKVGDILYCIYNNGVEQELSIGQKYTVDKVVPSELNNGLQIFNLAETNSRWMPWRFTKNPNHPIIVKYNMKKYNL